MCKSEENFKQIINPDQIWSEVFSTFILNIIININSTDLNRIWCWRKAFANDYNLRLHHSWCWIRFCWYITRDPAYLLLLSPLAYSDKPLKSLSRIKACPTWWIPQLLLTSRYWSRCIAEVWYNPIVSMSHRYSVSPYLTIFVRYILNRQPIYPIKVKDRRHRLMLLVVAVVTGMIIIKGWSHILSQPLDTMPSWPHGIT